MSTFRNWGNMERRHSRSPSVSSGVLFNLPPIRTEHLASSREQYPSVGSKSNNRLNAIFKADNWRTGGIDQTASNHETGELCEVSLASSSLGSPTDEAQPLFKTEKRRRPGGSYALESDEVPSRQSTVICHKDRSSSLQSVSTLSGSTNLSDYSSTGIHLSSDFHAPLSPIVEHAGRADHRQAVPRIRGDFRPPHYTRVGSGSSLLSNPPKQALRKIRKESGQLSDIPEIPEMRKNGYVAGTIDKAEPVVCEAKLPGAFLFSFTPRTQLELKMMVENRDMLKEIMRMKEKSTSTTCSEEYSAQEQHDSSDAVANCSVSYRDDAFVVRHFSDRFPETTAKKEEQGISGRDKKTSSDPGPCGSKHSYSICTSASDGTDLCGTTREPSKWSTDLSVDSMRVEPDDNRVPARRKTISSSSRLNPAASEYVSSLNSHTRRRTMQSSEQSNSQNPTTSMALMTSSSASSFTRSRHSQGSFIALSSAPSVGPQIHRQMPIHPPIVSSNMAPVPQALALQTQAPQAQALQVPPAPQVPQVQRGHFHTMPRQPARQPSWNPPLNMPAPPPYNTMPPDWAQQNQPQMPMGGPHYTWHQAPQVSPIPSSTAVPRSMPRMPPVAPQPPPFQRRPKQRGRIPFQPLSAEEQQQIEEHLEHLRSTIPKFAQVSKRRQQARWRAYQGKLREQAELERERERERELELALEQKRKEMAMLEYQHRLRQQQEQQRQQAQQQQALQQRRQQAWYWQRPSQAWGMVPWPMMHYVPV